MSEISKCIDHGLVRCQQLSRKMIQIQFRDVSLDILYKYEYIILIHIATTLGSA